MSSLFTPIVKNSDDVLYLIFRFLVGLLFLQHGLLKVGLLEGQFVIEGFMGFIGLCELAGGLAIVVGLWTRLVAVLGTVLMFGAYTTVHIGKALLPIMNGGEMSLLYVAAFVILFLYGSKRWSIEKALFKKEFF